MISTQKKTLKCAFIRSSSLGDVVLATACLQFLKKLDLDLEIFWLGTKPTLDLLKHSYPTLHAIELAKNNFIALNPTQIKSLKNLDFIIDLQANPRSKILCHYLRLKNKTPFFRLNKFRLQRQKLILKARVRNRDIHTNASVLKNHQYLHGLELLNGVLKKFNFIEDSSLSLGGVKPQLDLNISLSDFIESDLNFGHWIAVSPGAKYFSKRAPLEVFLNILDNVFYKIKSLGINPNDIGLVTLGDQSERALCSKLLEQINWGARKINYAGKLSLSESAVVLSKCKLTLCNDTALAHISEAVMTPTSVLFGPTVEEFGFSPHLSESIAFSANLGCRPCSKHGSTPCRFNDYLCFKNIPVAKIADHIINQILNDEV